MVWLRPLCFVNPSHHDNSTFEWMTCLPGLLQHHSLHPSLPHRSHWFSLSLARPSHPLTLFVTPLLCRLKIALRLGGSGAAEVGYNWYHDTSSFPVPGDTLTSACATIHVHSLHLLQDFFLTLLSPPLASSLILSVSSSASLRKMPRLSWSLLKMQRTCQWECIPETSCQFWIHLFTRKRCRDKSGEHLVSDYHFRNFLSVLLAFAKNHHYWSFWELKLDL